MDITNTIPKHVVTYQDPIIQDNSRGFELAFGLLLIFLVLIQLVFFVSIVKNRKNTVLELSQGSLLALLTATSAIATAACYFVMPQSDFFCNICEPLTLIPGSLIGSILLGRIWRINAILSPALKMGLSESSEDEESVGAKLKNMIMSSLNFLSLWENPLRWCKKGNSSGFRQMVSMRRLLRLVAILMVPQVLLQIFLLSCCKAERYVDLNEELTMGRYVCRRDHSWLMWVAYSIMSIPFLLTLILAASSSNLPSLFNETSGIFNAGIIICVSLGVGVPLIALSQSPVVSPDVMAFLTSSLILSIMLTPPFFIVRPKLMWVWSGKQVVVNTMLRDGDMSDGYSGSERSGGGYSFDVGDVRNTGWGVPLDAPDRQVRSSGEGDAATAGTVPSANSVDTVRKTVIRFSDQVDNNDSRSIPMSGGNVVSSTTIDEDDFNLQDDSFVRAEATESPSSVYPNQGTSMMERPRNEPSVTFDESALKHARDDTDTNAIVEAVTGSAQSLAAADDSPDSRDSRDSGDSGSVGKGEGRNVSVPQHWTIDRIATGDNLVRANSGRLSSMGTSSLCSDDFFDPIGVVGTSEQTVGAGAFSHYRNLFTRAVDGVSAVSIIGHADDFLPNPPLDDFVPHPRAEDFVPNPKAEDFVPDPRLDDFEPDPRAEDFIPNPRLDDFEPNPGLDDFEPNPRVEDFEPNPRVDDFESNPRLDDFDPNSSLEGDDFAPNGKLSKNVSPSDMKQAKDNSAQEQEAIDDFIVNTMRPFRGNENSALRSGGRRVSTGTYPPTSHLVKNATRSARFVSEASKRSSLPSSALVVCSSKPLPSRLLKQLIAIKKLTAAIVHHCMSGERVPHSELQSLRSKGKKFGLTCANLVIEPDEDPDEVESKKSSESKRGRFSFLTR